MDSEINVSCLMPADSSEGDSFRSTSVIGRRPKLRLSSSCCASTCMAFFFHLSILFPCWSQIACKASKGKPIVNDAFIIIKQSNLFRPKPHNLSQQVCRSPHR